MISKMVARTITALNRLAGVEAVIRKNENELVVFLEKDSLITVGLNYRLKWKDDWGTKQVLCFMLPCPLATH